MPKLPEVVTKKIGPLPLWGWVVAGAGAVFIFSRFKGGSSSGNTAGGIGIPILQPSGTGSIGDTSGTGNAVGSPNQNAMGGTDTQPGGVAPPHTLPNIGDIVPFPPIYLRPAPAPGPSIGDTVPVPPIFLANSPGGNPGGATPGPTPWTPPVNLPTAGALAAPPPSGRWSVPPILQQVSPTKVLDTSGGQRGVVNPGNRLLGYSNPATGELSQVPVPGWPAIWA